jgi:hypothetical protein
MSYWQKTGRREGKKSFFAGSIFWGLPKNDFLASKNLLKLTLVVASRYDVVIPASGLIQNN